MLTELAVDYHQKQAEQNIVKSQPANTALESIFHASAANGLDGAWSGTSIVILEELDSVRVHIELWYHLSCSNTKEIPIFHGGYVDII